MAGTAAKRYAGSTHGPMPGTLRWIMNGMTLIPAPTIEAMPVEVSATRPIPRTRPVREGAAEGMALAWGRRGMRERGARAEASTVAPGRGLPYDG
jgi:hypothetical protein